MSRRAVPHVWATRLVAVLAAIALLPVAWFGLAIVLIGGFVWAQLPDPLISDGDPCCGYPDTWGDVAVGLVFSVVGAALLAVIVRAIYVLVRWAVRAWSPSGRSWAVSAGAGAGVAVVGFGALLVAAATARQPTDCDAYIFRPASLRATDPEVRREEALRIDDCQPLSDATKAEVTRLLGPPIAKDDRRHGFSLWRYPDLSVRFHDGRSIHAGPPDDEADE